MCSQYECKFTLNELAELTNALTNTKVSFSAQVFPHTQAPVLIQENNQKIIKLMNYSLIPAWSKTAKPRFVTYNARLDRPLNNGTNQTNLEMIYDAPAWRTPFRQQRCLVPISGFIESCRTGRHAGNMVNFSAKNRSCDSEQATLLLAAGIWDQWVDPVTSEIIQSFAIITDNPVQFIQEVGHDRQPVFLNQQNAAIWLNHQQLNSKDAYDFLKSAQQNIDYDVTIQRQLKGFHQDDLFS